MICWLKPVPHLGYEAQLTSRHPVFRHTSLKVWSKEHRSAWELLGPLLDVLGHSLIFMRPVCTQIHYSLKTWTYPLYVPLIDGCTPNKQRCARKCGTANPYPRGTQSEGESILLQHVENQFKAHTGYPGTTNKVYQLLLNLCISELNPLASYV